MLYSLPKSASSVWAILYFQVGRYLNRRLRRSLLLRVTQETHVNLRLPERRDGQLFELTASQSSAQHHAKRNLEVTENFYTMPMWTCDFANCQKPAVRNLGDCILCKRHLCSDHLQDAFHKCPKWEVSSALQGTNLLTEVCVPGRMWVLTIPPLEPPKQMRLQS